MSRRHVPAPRDRGTDAVTLPSGRCRRLPRNAVVLPAGLESADYVDIFQLTTRRPDPRSPEQVVRAALESTPVAVREGIRFIHRYVMGLNLAPRHQPGHVAGWRISESTEKVVRLHAESSLGRGVIVLERIEPSTARVVTAITYKRRRLGPAIWRLVGAIHRRAAPRLMEWTARDEILKRRQPRPLPPYASTTDRPSSRT